MYAMLMDSANWTRRTRIVSPSAYSLLRLAAFKVETYNGECPWMPLLPLSSKLQRMALISPNKQSGLNCKTPAQELLVERFKVDLMKMSAREKVHGDVPDM
jgi:hypothetical protein